MKNIAIIVALLALAGCATPVAVQPNDQAQRSDDLHGQQVTINVNGGVLFYGDSPAEANWTGATLTGGQTSSASSTRQGATEQSATQSGQTGAQEATADGTLEVPLSPGN